MIVDYDGRILTQADPGPGEKIVVGPIDLAALRAERQRRCGHAMVANLRTETYTAYRQPVYPAGGADQGPLSVEINQQSCRSAKESRQWL
jgi:predicted amidohydrolase